MIVTKTYLKNAVTFFIIISIALSGIIYVPATAGAEGAADVPLTDDFDDSEDFDDDEDDEDYEDDDEYGIEDVMNFCATSISKKSVKLKWDKVEDVDGYEISYKAASSSKWITKEIAASKKALTVTKLKVNTKYNFRIRAFIHYEDDDDDDDDYEEDDEYTDEDFSDDEEFDEDDDEDYDELEEYEYGGYSKMNLKTLTKDGAGDKQAVSDKYEHSAHKSVKVPVLKKIQSTGGKVNLTWKKSQKASGYEVYMSKKAKSRFKCVAKLKKSGKVKYTSKKLKKGTTYYFKVRAYVKNGSTTSYTKYSKTKNIKIK